VGKLNAAQRKAVKNIIQELLPHSKRVEIQGVIVYGLPVAEYRLRALDAIIENSTVFDEGVCGTCWKAHAVRECLGLSEDSTHCTNCENNANWVSLFTLRERAVADVFRVLGPKAYEEFKPLCKSIAGYRPRGVLYWFAR
jgi:hypothetical protein